MEDPVTQKMDGRTLQSRDPNILGLVSSVSGRRRPDLKYLDLEIGLKYLDLEIGLLRIHSTVPYSGHVLQCVASCCSAYTLLSSVS